MRRLPRLTAAQVRTLRDKAVTTLNEVTLKEIAARDEGERTFYAGRRAVWQEIVEALPERGGVELPEEEGSEEEEEA